MVRVPLSPALLKLMARTSRRLEQVTPAQMRPSLQGLLPGCQLRRAPLGSSSPALSSSSRPAAGAGGWGWSGMEDEAVGQGTADLRGTLCSPFPFQRQTCLGRRPQPHPGAGRRGAACRRIRDGADGASCWLPEGQRNGFHNCNIRAVPRLK